MDSTGDNHRNSAMQLLIDRVDVRYASAVQPAVHGVSLALAAGDIGVLLGPSGCGKTTLLRALAGLEPLAAGRIALAGEILSQPGRTVAPEQRRMGMVFQDHALFPHMTVESNVAFGLNGMSAASRRQRVQDMLSLVGLHDLARRYPHELSGGQQQRVALARALAPQPQLLLLDEPFSSLDADLRERLAHELRQILKANGTTAMLVTHDQQEAFAMGDRIGVLEQGRLHQWSDAATLYHKPATRFVAQFIGQGMLADAHISADAPGLLRTPLGDFPLASHATLPPGQAQVLLRADDIVHDDASPWQATVLRKAFRGASILYTLQLDNGTTVLSEVPSHHDHAIGSRIGIRPDVQHVVAFAQDGI